MPLSPAALAPLLRLALVPGIGPQRLAGLIHHFGSAERALAAPTGEHRALPGVGSELAHRLREARAPAGDARLHAAMAALQRVRAVALTPDDLAYPAAFRALADPPFLLFAAGRLELLESPAVGIVGTRAPTPYGRATAAALSAGLVEAGYVVVSGMAKGIDAAAHAAALDAGGATVGVLGSGIEQVYPAENRRLFERVREAGLLLTEYPPGEQPRAGNFPRRNRLITALSQGIVVVEMGLKSGAQHTVNFALEQGREIFAVPGPIGSAASEGTNQLIKEGARVVTSVADVLEELHGVGRADAPPPPLARAAPPPSRSAEPELQLRTENETRLFGVLRPEPLHIDELADATGLAPAVLLTTLLELELRGAVEALPGKRFRRMED